MSAKASLTLLKDKKSQKIIYAESSNAFVDLLFNLLSLPLGSVVSLLTSTNMEGSFGNIYSSVENLSSKHMDSLNKSSLLNPILMSRHTTHLLPNDVYSMSNNFYTCFKRHGFTNVYGAKCRECSGEMYSPTSNQVRVSGGYVVGGVTFIVTDDLVVKPMSTLSIVALMEEAGVHELSEMEQIDVDVGTEEALKLLKEALNSKTVLTNVFLGNMSEKATKS